MPIMLLRERDVRYAFNKEDAKELGFELFRYEIWNLGVLTCFDSVYCRSKKEFKKLLGYWSKDTKWNYKESTDE